MRLDEFGELLPRSAVCQWCVLGLHEECEFPEGKDAEGWFTCCCGRQANQEEATSSDPKRDVGGQVRSPEELKDVVSAGRKRAALLYPIHAGMVCEWSGLLFAGGGVEPITGCNGNLIFPASADKQHAGQDPLAGNIHHGVDKSTLTNDRGNIHIVCLSCHSTWHALNNRYYAQPRPANGAPWLPSVPYKNNDPETRASIETLVATAAGRDSKNPRTSDPYRRGIVPEEEWLTA